MKAVQVTAPGGPEAMELVELPDPSPGPTDALVRIEYAGVNYIDVYQRAGLYPLPMPLCLGLEGAGTVLELGPSARGLGVEVGDRVAYSGVPGAYAELAVVPVERLVRVPDGLSCAQAAAVMLQGMTAHYLACSTFPLTSEHVCLVHAAAGGVGRLLAQVARLRGARVLGTVSTEAKASIARAAGVQEVIRYDRTDFESAVRARHPQGLDVVYDSVGAATFDKSLRCLRPRGTLVLYGQSSGPVPPFDPQRLNAHGSLFLTRPALQHYVQSRTELVDRASEVLGWVATGALTLEVEELPLLAAAEAHRRLEARLTTGKLVLKTPAHTG